MWVLGKDNKPWPIFVRVDNRPGEEPAIQETLATEVLEWDPEMAGNLNAKDPATFPHVITGMPASKASGLFNAPKIKF